MNAIPARRSVIACGVSAMLLFSMSGCSRNGHWKGTDVNGSKTQLAARELGASIAACMNQLRESADGSADVYAVVLVVLDDFSDIQIHANSEKHFAATHGTDTDRWYFGEFSSGGIPVEFGALLTHLGEVEDGDEDEEPENSNAVDWLAAMTLAMRKAQTEGAFVFGGTNATIYCSMADSLNAIWLEDVSARFLNDADAYAAAAHGIKAASADWYQSGHDQGSAAFRAAYESRLAQ